MHGQIISKEGLSGAAGGNLAGLEVFPDFVFSRLSTCRLPVGSQSHWHARRRIVAATQDNDEGGTEKYANEEDGIDVGPDDGDADEDKGGEIDVDAIELVGISVPRVSEAGLRID